MGYFLPLTVNGTITVGRKVVTNLLFQVPKLPLQLPENVVIVSQFGF